MSGAAIQERIKKGLSRAIDRTGSASSPLVYKIERTSGGGTPMNPLPIVTNSVLLVDAVFTGYNEYTVDQTLIKTGDRRLVTNGDIVISENDTIKVDGDEFNVEAVDVKSPAGVPLAYISQLRPL